MLRGRVASLLLGLAVGLVAGLYLPLPAPAGTVPGRTAPEAEFLRLMEAWRAADPIGVFARLEPRLQRELTLDRVYAEVLGRSEGPSPVLTALEGAERHVKGGGRFVLEEDDALLTWSAEGDFLYLHWTQGRWRLAEIGRRGSSP